MPKKTFTAGEVLAAADVNTFLMDQSVMTFADSGARGSAIGTATEGMLTYLEDTDAYQSWNGSAWVGVGGGAATNAIINGAFDFWQRGTSFTNPADASYTADRWLVARNGTAATRTISQQAFTLGSAPVAGYEATFFYRNAVSVAGTGETYHAIQQKIEDVRTFAGQTITVSLFLKAEASRTVTLSFQQQFGSGGSSTVFVSSKNISATTSWERYTLTFDIPSISGKTIGAGSALVLNLNCPLNAISTTDIWGVQVEAGTTATPFRRNANSLQGELAACQRYYWRTAFMDTNSRNSGYSPASSTTRVNEQYVQFPVAMRSKPTSVEWGNQALSDGVNTAVNLTTLTMSEGSNIGTALVASVASGLTQFRPYALINNNNANGFLGISAEL